jgi:Domain of unknown function (DUF5753)/Helix-turn-helix domain
VGGSVVLRLVVGRQLGVLRERAGLSFREAGEVIYASEWTVRRMERGDVGFKLNNVKGLLGAYGVSDPGEVEAFLALAAEANSPGWWQDYGDVVPAWFRMFVGLEEAASVIRSYQPQFVPGLLQTAGYARALTVAGFPGASEEEVERRVAFRLARQGLLSRPDPPRLWVVMEETVLRRGVGGSGVMREQVGRLIEASRLPNVTLQVMPFVAGPHPAMFGPFVVCRFPVDEVPDIVYGETMTGGFYLDKPDEVGPYMEALDRVCAQAASVEDTRALLTTTHKEIGDE